ncbi:profilin PRF [Cardiosporidium cionae]|uniref:Profilin n=1 Tax=Cardiosporidium cionae TaxID=476202 RepID=A0ABQ7J9I1_9APIC|nr:profilin PRF [Cardiosporidium cionae]|eukprot:KAF8820609.1 profilin PRF [Cardiosporidium cionae]
MAYDDSGWSETIREWLIDGGHCVAGALASAEDGIIYAACYSDHVGDEEAFAYVYSDDHEEETLADDGESTKAVTINEPTTILQAVDEGKAPDGVWLGGRKFKLVDKDSSVEYNECVFNCLVLARSKGGATVVKTSGGTIIIAIYDDDLDQRKGNCRQAALAFSENLESQGY